MRRGWFVIPGVQDGDRTLAQQIKGLGLVDLRGMHILELGCAEGLMSKWLIENCHAAAVTGVDSVGDHIKEAQRQCQGLPCGFTLHDLNVPRPWMHFDVVFALAILQKLKRPSEMAATFAAHARRMMIVRLPPEHAPAVVDPRSGNVRHEVGDAIISQGFALEQITRGSFDEWCGHYVRRA